MASQHTDKKRKDPSDVRLAQPKPKKKSPAQVARDRARQKEFWKRMRLPRQLRADNPPCTADCLHRRKPAHSPPWSVSQSQRTPAAWIVHRSDGSKSKSYQLQETETVASPQFSVVSQSESENSSCLHHTSDGS